MSAFVAALPMYDWPELRAAVDAQWVAMRDRLRATGIDAPARLARRNADLPAVPGGIRDADGRPIAPDPATLPPDGLDLAALWRHPALLVSQTCWGPLDTGLAPHVRIIAQPDYTPFEGGQGVLYASAVVMRGEGYVQPPAGGQALLPLHLLRNRVFAFNGPESMSGLLGIARDLEEAGHGLALFAQLAETGSHRESARAVADGRADAAAIDCRSWSYVQRFEPEVAAGLRVVGWTSRRPGLPFIAPATMPDAMCALLKAALPG